MGGRRSRSTGTPSTHAAAGHCSASAEASILATTCDRAEPWTRPPVSSGEADVTSTELSAAGSGRDRSPRATTVRPKTSAPLLVYYHGGGFVLGDLDTHDALCRVICRDAGVHVLSVDYRLAPEHKAPAAVDDAYAALPVGRASTPPNWAPTRAASPSAATARAATWPRWCRSCARDDGERLPALQLLLYPSPTSHGQTRSRDLFADGLLPAPHDMDWLRRPVPRRLGRRRRPIRGCRRCWPTTCPGCRRRWWSRRASTRCATRARSTPRRCAAAGVPVDLRRVRVADRTASPTSSRSAAAAPTAIAEMISALRAHLRPRLTANPHAGTLRREPESDS